MNIIITGASSGLGAELAKLYATPNMTLGLLGRNEARLNETAQYCRDHGANVVCATIDIIHADELVSWLDKFDSQYHVDIVIANAGLMTTIKNNNYLEHDLDIKALFDTNFFGSLNTINPVLRKMRERGQGHVVIVSSLSASRGIPLFPAYAASKAALKIYYEGIRGLLLKNNIFVTIVCPSFIDTNMIKGHTFHNLFVMDANYAARRIKKAIERRYRIVNFPMYHHFGIKSLGLLPSKISDWILIKFFGL